MTYGELLDSFSLTIKKGDKLRHITPEGKPYGKIRTVKGVGTNGKVIHVVFEEDGEKQTGFIVGNPLEHWEQRNGAKKDE